MSMRIKELWTRKKLEEIVNISAISNTTKKEGINEFLDFYEKFIQIILEISEESDKLAYSWGELIKYEKILKKTRVAGTEVSQNEMGIIRESLFKLIGKHDQTPNKTWENSHHENELKKKELENERFSEEEIVSLKKFVSSLNERLNKHLDNIIKSKNNIVEIMMWLDSAIKKSKEINKNLNEPPNRSKLRGI